MWRRMCGGVQVRTRRARVRRERARAGARVEGVCTEGGRGGAEGAACACADVPWPRGSADAKGMCADVPGAAQPRVSKLKHARSTYQCGRLTDGAHYRVASPRHCQQACLPRPTMLPAHAHGKRHPDLLLAATCCWLRHWREAVGA